MFPKETKDQEDIIAFYGEPGDIEQVRLHLPYPMKLSWDENSVIKSFYCHAKVADSLFNILAATLAVYGYDEIRRLGLDRWGGCYNPRSKRGSKKKMSLHSWAIALDIGPDADREKFRWKADKVKSSGPEYDAFWRIVENEGWKSLGRSNGYDWMHIQATS